MVTHADFFGGAVEITLSGSVSLKWGSNRLHVLAPGSSSYNVDLPDATTHPLGGPAYYILNVSGSTGTLVIRDDGANTLATLAAGEAAVVALNDNTTADGIWLVEVRTTGVGETLQSNLPPAATIFYVMGGGTNLPGGPHYDDVHNYLVSGDAWSVRQSFPDPNVWDTPTGTYQGALYIPGGAQDAAVYRVHRQYVKATDSYVDLADTLNPRRRAAGVGLSGSKFYFINGRGDQEAYEDNDEYDTATDAWSEKTPIVNGDTYLVNVAGHAANSRVYRLEGALLSVGPDDGNFEYDPSGDSWSAKTDNPNLRYWSGIFGFAADIHTVEGGGAVKHGAYNVTGDSWATKATPTTSGYFGPVTGVIAAKGYLTSGISGASVGINVHQEYDPVGNTWATKAVLPNPVRGNGMGESV
jgi:hypothetical protein